MKATQKGIELVVDKKGKVRWVMLGLKQFDRLLQRIDDLENAVPPGAQGQPRVESLDIRKLKHKLAKAKK
jgi:hypothetical protein